MGLVGIGEFARLSRLSPKALRRYDELGVLRPERVDPDSGYRWYETGQLEQAQLVASVRQIGVPLAQIKAILGLDPEAAAEQIGTYWSAAEAGHAYLATGAVTGGQLGLHRGDFGPATLRHLGWTEPRSPGRIRRAPAQLRAAGRS
jgi:DNA-binding transcriptional MerR regulator